MQLFTYLALSHVLLKFILGIFTRSYILQVFSSFLIISVHKNGQAKNYSSR